VIMKKQQLLINASFSVIQIAVNGIVLFILYKFLLKTIGIELLGVWSLVLAATSVTQIANLGLSGSVVKFVASYIAQEKNEKVAEVIQTAFFSVGIFFAFILIISYPVVKLILNLVISAELISYSIIILPHAFLSLWFLMMTSVFHAGLDGVQRIDIRNFLLMGGGIFYLLLCFILAPSYGITGIAYARVIQNFAILIISWFLLRKHLPLLPYFPCRFSRSVFKEIIGYAVNFQIITLAAMLYDPITKALLSKFGGVSIVGYYEMANKMVLQFRSVIVSANQVLIPAFADLHEKSPEKIQSVYLTSFELVFYLSLPLYSLLIVFTPLISVLWIGYYEKIFVFSVIFLTVGWFINTLAGPAYFANLGKGELRWNVISHIAIAFLNISLGFLLGVFYHGIGIVVAWAVSLMVGSGMIIFSYQIKNGIALNQLLPHSSKILIAACLIGLFFIRLTCYRFSYMNVYTLNMINLFLFILIVSVPFWKHPIRKRLIGWVLQFKLF